MGEGAGMKKIMWAGLVVAAVLSLTANTLTAKTESENVEGKVTSVMSADPARGMKPTIAVTDKSGERTLFEITPTTTLYGIDMKPITMEAISKGTSVKVKGTAITEGIGSATSIRLLK